MEVTYRNRDPLDSELEAFLKSVAQDLELDTDEVIVYPSSNYGGVYVGREDGVPVIGITKETPYVTAHELGHDRYYKEILGELLEADPDLNDEGAIDATGRGGESLDLLANEIFADNVARSYIDQEGVIERRPLEYVSNHLKVFADLIRMRAAAGSSLIEESPDGFQYFKAPEDFRDYELLGDRIRELQDRNEERLSELLHNTWEERRNQYLTGENYDIVLDSIGAFTDIDNNAMPHSRSREDEVRESIDQNLDVLSFKIQNRLRSKTVSERIDTGTKPHPSLEEFSTPSPSHFSAVIQREGVNEMDTDYTHQVGNFVGSFIYDLGITFRDLEENEESLRELAQRSLDLSLELGKNPEFHSIEDFEDGLEFLIADLENI